MKHLELHIIQSVPVSCLNRDDLNSPKTAIFGGVQRARVSSQSWKRAIRELAKERSPEFFKANRSRRMVHELSIKLEKKDIAKDIAIIISQQVAGIIETLDSKTDADGYKKIKTMMFFSDAEYEAISNALSNNIIEIATKVHDSQRAFEVAKHAFEKMNDTDPKKEETKKTLEKLEKEIETGRKGLLKAFGAKPIKDAIKSAQLKDAADIALFGRMVANDPSLNVEAATMFSHALSTHKADNEIDFFAAVDDLQSTEELGAGMTGTLEFNSATYYRFAALNLDMLADGDHLKHMTIEERQDVVRTFMEATIKAIPGARKNTMNGNTVPNYVLGVVREIGHPIQLINAFENPVRSSQGYAFKSVELLKSEYEKIKDTWEIKAVFEKAIPEISINSFLEGMVSHVI